MGNVWTRASPHLKQTVASKSKTPKLNNNIIAVKVRHILVHDEELLQRCANEIQQGKPFEVVAKEFSSCPSAKRGGNLGWVARGILEKEFEVACLSVPVNQLSRVNTAHGWHLFQVEAQKVSEPETFEEESRHTTENLNVLKLLSNSIVTRSVPEAQPSWARSDHAGNQTAEKRRPLPKKRLDATSENRKVASPGFLTEKQLDELFVRWKNDSQTWTVPKLSQEYNVSDENIYKLLSTIGVWKPTKDKDGTIRGYLCSTLLDNASKCATDHDGERRGDNGTMMSESTSSS
eukprot:jgi/Galph1/3954/GphlegSOOS_G2623.1